MPDIENACYVAIRVNEGDVDAFVNHLKELQKARKVVRFAVAVDTRTAGSSIYGDVIFPIERVDPGLIINSGVLANEPGNTFLITAHNSQMTTSEIRGKNALAASANKLVPRDENKK